MRVFTDTHNMLFSINHTEMWQETLEVLTTAETEDLDFTYSLKLNNYLELN